MTRVGAGVTVLVTRVGAGVTVLVTRVGAGVTVLVTRVGAAVTVLVTRVGAVWGHCFGNLSQSWVSTQRWSVQTIAGPGGALKTSFYKALLTYRNSPCPDTRVSPAMCVLGRATRDLIPTLPSRLQPPTNPSENKRQAALQRRQALANARWQEHSVGLSPLRCGDRVHVQDLTHYTSLNPIPSAHWTWRG